MAPYQPDRSRHGAWKLDGAGHGPVMLWSLWNASVLMVGVADEEIEAEHSRLT